MGWGLEEKGTWISGRFEDQHRGGRHTHPRRAAGCLSGLLSPCACCLRGREGGLTQESQAGGDSTPGFTVGRVLPALRHTSLPSRPAKSQAKGPRNGLYVRDSATWVGARLSTAGSPVCSVPESGHIGLDQVASELPGAGDRLIWALTRVSQCLGVCVFFPGFDGENEVRILDGAGHSFLPLLWPEAPTASRRSLGRSRGK